MSSLQITSRTELSTSVRRMVGTRSVTSLVELPGTLFPSGWFFKIQCTLCVRRSGGGSSKFNAPPCVAAVSRRPCSPGSFRSARHGSRRLCAFVVASPLCVLIGRCACVRRKVFCAVWPWDWPQLQASSASPRRIVVYVSVICAVRIRPCHCYSSRPCSLVTAPNRVQILDQV